MDIDFSGIVPILYQHGFLPDGHLLEGFSTV